MAKTRVRDILHGYIPLEGEDELFLESPFLQRLRYIRQNDLDFLVFPALNTTRFEHSLGVMYLAGELAENALQNANKDEREDYLQALYESIPSEYQYSKNHHEIGGSFRRAARWYGLLHDVGHLPFSHLTEHALKKAKPTLLDDLYGNGLGFKKLHEAAGFRVIEHESLEVAFKSDPQAAWMVRELLSAKNVAIITLKPLKDIVDSEVDADRIDSTARDGYLSGGDFGNYDIHRLIKAARVTKWNGGWHTLFGTRALGPIEGLLLERYKTHRWIHFHPKVLALKNAYQLCISALDWEPKLWSQNSYFNKSTGFLDDSSVLRAIWGITPDSESLSNARDAILLRTETARPLWKVGDDFQKLCEEIAEVDREWQRDNFERLPILNRFGPLDANLLEERLNLAPPSGLSFLVSHNLVTPVELFKPSGEIETSRKSRYYVLDSNEKPTPLTHESGVVLNLPSIVHREPKISVTLLGKKIADSQTQQQIARNHFIKVARDHISEIYANRQ